MQEGDDQEIHMQNNVVGIQAATGDEKEGRGVGQ
jgi:hypothetical protein